MSAAVRLAAAFFTLAVTGVQAGGPLSLCNNKTPIKYPGAGVVNLNYDPGTLGARSNAAANLIVTNAVALWTNVGTATITIGRGPDLPVDVTVANYTTYYNNSSDMLNPVIYDTDGTIIDDLLGTNQKSSVLGFAGSSATLSPTCAYTEGRAIISGFLNVSDTTMGVVIAHEIGHLIGLDHTQLNSVQGIASTGNYPLMYPIANRNSVTLHEDDIAAVSALYPDPTLSTLYGQISGTFVLADGVTPVKGANLWASETTTHKVYSIVSDYLTQNTGFFSLLLPVGAYNIHAGTVLSTFVGGSRVGPYSAAFPASLSFQPPLYVGGVAMSPVTLGNATPTSFNISAGCAATLTFRIDGTGTVGGNCGPASFALNAGKTGTGSGTVTSAPAGINCGATCSSSFATGSLVTLTASASVGSTFSGWSGGGCSGTGTCSVTVSAATTVTATFTLQQFNLTASHSGTGAGTITSSPAGINCGATCTVAFDFGSNVTLTAIPVGGSSFDGWSGGGCSGTGTCLINVSAATSVTAAFNIIPTAPGAPTIGTATAGNAQAMITFTPPASNGNSPITGYTATCNPNTLQGTSVTSPVNVLNLVNGTQYTCTVTANNVIGPSAASGTVMVTPLLAAVPALVGVSSRKFHGSPTPFDVDIDTNVMAITGPVSVEPRAIGNGHTIVFHFNNTIDSVASVAIVDDNNAPVAATPTVSGSDVIVTIPSILDNRRARISLSNVMGPTGTVTPQPVSMGFLIGDFNSTGSVNASDISAVKAQSGLPLSQANFKFDVNTSGSISSTDVSAVKARAGLVLP